MSALGTPTTGETLTDVIVDAALPVYQQRLWAFVNANANRKLFPKLGPFSPTVGGILEFLVDMIGPEPTAPPAALPSAGATL